MSIESVPNGLGPQLTQPDRESIPEPVLTAERYLNGLRQLYESLGRCSCRGDDVTLRLPVDNGIASASYIGGIILISSRETGVSDFYTMDDTGIVLHTSGDMTYPAGHQEVDDLFSRRLEGASADSPTV